ncbi:hypothetical protein [Agarilytica rhodophyticola]|uniref:hypothetical protein n=1 Tax=Agarilytica rhodophyticola TaxID=1737490 RepID=UPI000B3461AA|nr:hypothetical protein [Agarilytica rhodophyticola]
MYIRLIKADPDKKLTQNFILKPSPNDTPEDWMLKAEDDSVVICGIEVDFAKGGQDVTVVVNLDKSDWVFMDPKTDLQKKSNNKSKWSSYGDDDMCKIDLEKYQIRTPESMTDKVTSEDCPGIYIIHREGDMPPVEVCDNGLSLKMVFSHKNSEYVSFSFVAYKSKASDASSDKPIYKGFISKDPSFTVRCT